MSFCRWAFVRPLATSSMKMSGRGGDGSTAGNRRATEWPWASAGGGPPNISRPTRRGRTSWLVVVIEQFLERLVVDEAVCAVYFFRDAVTAFLNPAGCVGINRGAV